MSFWDDRAGYDITDVKHPYHADAAQGLADSQAFRADLEHEREADQVARSAETAETRGGEAE